MTDQSGADLSAPEDDALFLAENDQEHDRDTLPADDAGADTLEGGEGNDTPAPKRQTAQERIDELTRDRRDAERDAEYWKSKATASDPKPAAQPQAETDPEPDPADYEFGETDAGYVKALGAHAARQEFNRLDQGRQQQSAAQTALQAHQSREAEFAKDKPDFSDKVYKTEWVCTADMAAAIQSSDEGPAVSYHLANNPDEARRIAALPPIAQVRELGRIEGRLISASPSNSSAKTVSDAPPVPPNVRGAGGKFKAAADTGDFASFEAAYVNKS